MALLVPSNRFEVLECRAAVEAAAAGAQDTAVARSGALDVLCQHILGMACAAPFRADDLYAEVTSAEPYAHVDRDTFDRALAFVAHGGYALAGYERFAKIRQVGPGTEGDGRPWRIANGRVAQTYRMNVGTIVEASSLKVRLVRGQASKPDAAKPGEAGGGRYTGPLRSGGRVLGEVEEGFLESLVPGDTFLFGGEVLALQGIVENEALVSRSRSETPRVPSYAGSKFPLSTYLASGVRDLLADPTRWAAMPMQVAEWLGLQRERSALPPTGDLLVETFPRAKRHYLVCYPFEGRLAHQTLGMLLTRRMERAYLKPLGFVANDYALAVWAATDVGARIAGGLVTLADLFAQDMLGDDLEEWLGESHLMKRTFPPERDRVRPHRAQLSRPREERPAGDGVDRPHLRRAAPPRAGPHPPPGRTAGRLDRPARHRAAGGDAGAHRGPHPAQGPRPHLAARRADHAGGGAREDRRGGTRADPGGRRGGAGAGDDGVRGQ